MKVVEFVGWVFGCVLGKWEDTKTALRKGYERGFFGR